MVHANAIFPSADDPKLFVVIDLLGDLDATLGEILAGTLERHASLRGGDLVVNCKHLADASPDGIAALSRALESVRLRGYRIFLIPGSRKLRLAFKAAQISCPQIDILPAAMRRRHVMLAHHGSGTVPAPVKRRPRGAGKPLPLHHRTT
jgi:anti-anti-sigma regulatory factor